MKRERKTDSSSRFENLEDLSVNSLPTRSVASSLNSAVNQTQGLISFLGLREG